MTLSTEPAVLEARDIAETCLCFHTQKAARALARRFDTVFRPLGITNGQFSMMTFLSAAEARRMKEMAAFLRMDRTTLTAAVKALERVGLAKVTADPKDRRSRLIALTAAGRKVFEQAKPIWCAEHARLEKEKPGLDAAALRTILSALA